jgi:hypothetical protein
LRSRQISKSEGSGMGPDRRQVTSKVRQSREKVGSTRNTNAHNIVLTGPGRSGTTLACHLLNKLPNTVALAEPLPPGRFEEQMPDYEAVCDELEKVYRRMRHKAHKHGVVRSKHIGGIVPDNTKSNKVGGVRQRIAVVGKIPVGKDLDRDFFLAIKQPGMFTALLPHLAKRFPCYAIVRNPLAILASTGSIKPKEKKNPTAKMRYDAGYHRQVQEGQKAGTNRLDRMLQRIHYTFERYEKLLPREHVIRYEDICASGGRALGVIVPSAADLDVPLENKNANPLYDRKRVLRVGERLLESEGAYWNFYTREDVQEVMDRFS